MKSIFEYLNAVALLLLALAVPPGWAAGGTTAPNSWIPARWPGGPVELARRARAKTPLADLAVRDALANWYDPATLKLLEGSPVNCLLVTWSAGTEAALERRQQQLVKAYTTEAHRRGVAIVGVIYPGADPAGLVAAATDARLDGLALDGEFPAGFTAGMARAAAATPGSPILVSIVADPGSIRTGKVTIPAVEGVSPKSRNLADMGIRAAPSSEPWIESNIWLVRSFRLEPAPKPVWISYELEAASPADYARSVADAAVAGGRWIVALDDGLRVKLRRNDPAALAAWQGVGASLRFAEDHAEWRTFEPFGNLAIVMDTAADRVVPDETLKLVARRQVPYRLIMRSQLTAASLAGFRGVLATELAPPSDAERKILKDFADKGGQVVAGPSWGGAPKDEPFAEVSQGKGRVIVYQDPDPEAVARDMRDLLSHKDAGFTVFNVPSVISYASTAGDGKRLLIQLLNYADAPAADITIRVGGTFQTARLFTPEGAPVNLEMSVRDGQTDITIPKLSLWGGVLLERRSN